MNISIYAFHGERVKRAKQHLSLSTNSIVLVYLAGHDSFVLLARFPRTRKGVTTVKGWRKKMNAAWNMLRGLSVANRVGREYSNYAKLGKEMVTAMNKDMIVCWHPEQRFPYECSLPLPEEKRIISNSVLCVGEKEIAEVFKTKRQEVVIEELCKITSTTKHRWYPKNWRKRNRKTEPDRPYL